MNADHLIRRALLIIFCSLVLVARLPAPAQALWAHDPNVNVTVSLATFQNANGYASIPDGTGGQFIAFLDSRNTINTGDLFVQHVDALGRALWTPNGVPISVNSQQKLSPALCTDGAGGIMVTWVDSRDGNTDIYAQRVSAAGAVLWTVNGVGICTNVASAYQPAIATDFAGGAFIAWSDWRAPITHIAMQRVNSAGAAQWVADGISVTNIAGANAPLLASFAQGPNPFVQLAWTDTRNSATTGQDIYSQIVNGSGTALYTANGFVVCNASGNQTDLTMIEDPHFGTYFTWTDPRAGSQAYMQRFAFFSTSAYLTANGVPVAPTATAQTGTLAVADGLGGLYVAFSEQRTPSLGTDTFAQHVNFAGNALWGATGVTVASDILSQIASFVALNPTGGLDVVWNDGSAANGTLRAQRCDPSGIVQWTPKGVLFAGTGTLGNTTSPLLQYDNDNGPVVSFYEGATGKLALHGIDRWGKLGAEPVLTSVRDVPNEQGGQVRVSWQASALDTDPADYSVANYYVYRAMATAPALAAARAGRVIADAGSAEATSDSRAILRTHVGQALYYWEQVGTQKATHLATYSFVCPTTSDSLAGSNPRTAFLVYAATNANPFWTSQPDSGYSVDNLAPLTPAPFAAQYSAGTSTLHWLANRESDLAGYRLYRGTTAGFATDAAHLVAAVNDTTYTDAAGTPAYNKLVAVDVHGNVSPAALAQPSGTLDAGAPEAHALAFAAPAPDPLRAGEGTTLRFTLPADSRVSLDVLDALGRRVAQPLAGASLTAGDHVVRWSARDANARALASGLYFVRLTSSAGTRVRRLVVLGGD